MIWKFDNRGFSPEIFVEIDYEVCVVKGVSLEIFVVILKCVVKGFSPAIFIERRLIIKKGASP